MAFFLYILAFLILYVFTKHFQNKIQNLPPSPFPCLPLIGHLYLLRNPIYKIFEKIAGRYGPVVLLQLGNRRVLVISSPTAAEECLTKNDINFANRPQLMVGKYFGNDFKSLLWSPYGDLWRNLRRIASTEVLSNSRLKMLANIRANEVKLTMRNLLKFDEEKPIEMRTMFFELTANAMTTMLIGKRFYGENVADQEEARRYREGQMEAAKAITITNYGDFLPCLKSKKLERMMLQCKKNRYAFFLNLVEKAREGMKNNAVEEKKKTMVEVLLSRQETEPEFYTDEMIANFLLILLVAGTETTIMTMEWATSLLLNHPEVLQKAQEEIDNVIGTDRLIEETDMPNLPYLRCIISETMRMYPLVPMLVPHESREECTVGGYRIPAGTMLFVNVWAIQHDPKIWADPGKFKPDRFEGIEGMGKDGFRLMPFGSGRRACPGDNLAMRMIGLTVGSLIQCFELKRVGKEMVDLTERVWLPNGKVNPLEAKCRPRAPMVKLLGQI